MAISKGNGRVNNQPGQSTSRAEKEVAQDTWGHMEGGELGTRYCPEDT